jgi:3',5'-cyclic AMP phosphodiesterase CpdA
MTSALTIAHLSDLHLSALHKRSHIRRTRRVLDYVNALGVDHVVVTGDITADGTAEDYRVARSVFASAGMLTPGRMTVAIGNHDVFGGVHTAEDVLTFPRRCAQTDDKAKLHVFGMAFQETFRGSLMPSEKRIFPFAKMVGDTAIIVVNTVAPYSRVKNPLGSNGSVDDRSFDALSDILGSAALQDRRKIVALHHHFHKMRDARVGAVHSVWGAIERQTMKLRGKSRLVKLFARHRVELVLHGHIHQSMEYERDGVRFVNGGGSVSHDASPDLHINIIRMHAAGTKVEIHRIPFEGIPQRIERVGSVETGLLAAGHAAA